MAAGTHGPLQGLRIALTREAADNAGLQAALANLGADVAQCPLIHIELVPPDKVHLKAGSYGWLAATSRRALTWVDWLLGFNNPPVFGRCACVGETTAEYARLVLQMEPVVPAVQDAEHLAKAMRRIAPLADVHVLAPRGNLAPDTLPHALEDMGAIVDAPVVYHTGRDAAGAASLGKLTAAGSLEAVVFASPSAVQYALEGGADLTRVACFSIGPTTSDALLKAGIRVAGQAATPDDEALLAIIEAGKAQQ